MRRFLAFVMCISGFTLAVSWARADEPAAASAADEPQPQAELVEQSASVAKPSARPEVVRTEPGAYRERRPSGSAWQNAGVHPESGDSDPAAPSAGSPPEHERRLESWWRIFDFESEFGSAGVPIAQRLIERLEPLYEQVGRLENHAELLAERFDGPALAESREKFAGEIERVTGEIARIEEFLQQVGDRSSNPTTPPQNQRAAGQYRDEPVQPERRTDRAAAQIRQMRQRMAEIRSDRSEQGDSVAQRLEQNLDRLRDLAESIQDSATAEAKTARQTIEREIDNVERYLAERRERRDAAELAPEQQGERTERDRDGDDVESSERAAATREVHERLRHIHAAIEHLNAAGMHDVAENLQRHAREMAVAQERAQQQQQRRSAAERERAAAERGSADESPHVRELAEQIGELRRELRRLRQEITELREQHATPSEESKDN